MNTKLTIFSITLATIGLMGVISGCHKPKTTASATRPKVTIGLQLSPAMALVMVAKDKGCFEQEGLDVDLKGFTAGKFALQAFLGKSLDYAIAGEVPTTLATLQGNQAGIYSQVVEHTTNEVRVVARRDGVLNDPASYFHAKKRKLATSFGGGPEFYTYNFLKKYHISKGQVSIISQKPGDMPAAVASGSVDAISVFDPFAYIAEQKLGPQGTTFSDSKIYSELYVLVGNPSDATAKPQVVNAILRALVKAQQIIASDPQGSQQIVVKYTKLDPKVVSGIWGNFAFAPALNDLLVNDMKAEAAWAKEKGDVPADHPVPDFRKTVIIDAPLKAIKPDAVKLTSSSG